ncbi:MAG: hypothetical protein IJR90_07685 [Clostridia bacterium]|nr:hypothetical protein [Clostridia bacterium]
MKSYLIQGISLPYTVGRDEAVASAEKTLKRCGARAVSSAVFRRSIDARKKDDIRFVYSVLCAAEGGDADKLKRAGAVEEKTAPPSPVAGNEPLAARPLVCGFGPAGMFASLTLAENGYRPVVCERGPSPGARRIKIERFFATGELDTEGNVQFGAGGAGMFSDGKLMTRINDPYCRFVLERLRDLGAPDDVLVNARPHIGTDLLIGVVERAARRVTELGGEVLFDTRIDGFKSDSSGRINGVITPGGEIPCGALILAHGHSARDTYTALRSGGYDLKAKPISVGFRIEHLREDIDKAMFGDHAGDPLLGAAEYNLSTRIGGTGVYTFCMCPGGEVVAAASEEGGVVTNGASRFARDGRNSNAAVALSLAPADPMEFQRSLERAAFKAGGGRYAAPIQTVGDFLSGKSGTAPSRVAPTYTRGETALSDIASILPRGTYPVFADGLRSFGKKISGFDSPDALLTGLETRTTAPFRMARGERMTAPGHDNLYPCGEGAGWAGGITSAAVDGVRCAEALINRYKAY